MNQIRRSSLFAIGTWLLSLVLIALAVPMVSAALPGAHAFLVTKGVLDAPHAFTRVAPLMVGMIINVDNIKGLTTTFKTIFNNAFGLAESAWEKVATSVPSGSKSQTYAWLGMSTRFREWIGERVIQNLKQHGFTIVNKRFEDTIGVPADDVKDDTYGVYSPLFAQLGYDAKSHPDELLFDLVSRGDAVKCYDGQNFLDADHPVLDENGVAQSVSNFQAGALPLWLLIDNTKPIKPFIMQTREAPTFQAKDNPNDDNVFNRNEFIYGATGRYNVGVGLWQLCFGSRAALSAANYEAARIALRSVTADGGKKLNITPKLLVVGPKNEGAANALVKAQRDAFGADNIWYGTADVLVVPWLE